MNPHPLTIQLVERISSDNAMHLRSLQQAISALRPQEARELESYIDFCVSEGIDLDLLALAYRTITDDTLREQIYFRRHGKYRYSTFAEVADSVYFADDYMRRYMYGLALTLYLWPNHLEIVRFFRKAIAGVAGNAYLEIGPGHGAFFRHAVALGGFCSYLGVDISPTSLDLTRRLLKHDDAALAGKDWKLVESDFLALADTETRFDAIVMGEVLEHVEDPGKFLERIRSLSNPGAFVFVTTAVNAPAVDHIFLFRSVDEVTNMATAAGLEVADLLAVPYKGLSLEEAVAQMLPINVALVLKPRA